MMTDYYRRLATTNSPSANRSTICVNSAVSTADPARRSLILAGLAAAGLAGFAAMAEAAPTEIANPDQSLIDAYHQWSAAITKDEELHKIHEERATVMRSIRDQVAFPEFEKRKRDPWLFWQNKFANMPGPWRFNEVNLIKDNHNPIGFPGSERVQEERSARLEELRRGRDRWLSVTDAAYEASGLTDINQQIEDNYQIVDELQGRILALPARTKEGCAVKAAVAYELLPHSWKEEEGAYYSRYVASMIAQIAAVLPAEV